MLGSIPLLVGNGDGTFQNAKNSPVLQPHHLAVADFNGDSMLDVAIAGDESQRVSILINLGAGNFGPATNMISGGRPHAIACGDFDGDGKVDIATVHFSQNRLSVLLGNGNGTFHDGISMQVGLGPHHVIAADMDNNGSLDLVIANSD
ncbi:MAG: VCBS repeat-containing protein, partial [Acidobacteriota bacterium]